MTSALFPATRQAGLDRLYSFLPRAGRHYAANRNHDLGTDAIADIAAMPRGSTLLMYEMPTGQNQTAFVPVDNAMKRSGHDLIRLRRPWDASFWPHATAGFFKVKDGIPAALQTLGMGD